MRSMQKTLSLLSMVAVTTMFAAGALAQSQDDLKNDEKTPGDVLVYGMGYSGNRYSPLTQINKDNVEQSGPEWAFSITDNRGRGSLPAGQGRRHLRDVAYRDDRGRRDDRKADLAGQS